MNHKLENGSLPGHEGSGTITIYFHIQSGVCSLFESTPCCVTPLLPRCKDLSIRLQANLTLLTIFLEWLTFQTPLMDAGFVKCDL